MQYILQAKILSICMCIGKFVPDKAHLRGNQIKLQAAVVPIQ